MGFYFDSDRLAHARVHGLPGPTPRCGDCGTENDVRVSTPVDGGHWYCDPCWRARQAIGREFDPPRSGPGHAVNRRT
jgi:hypothetical protein